MIQLLAGIVQIAIVLIFMFVVSQFVCMAPSRELGPEEHVSFYVCFVYPLVIIGIPVLLWKISKAVVLPPPGDPQPEGAFNFLLVPFLALIVFLPALYFIWTPALKHTSETLDKLEGQVSTKRHAKDKKDDRPEWLAYYVDTPLEQQIKELPGKISKLQTHINTYDYEKDPDHLSSGRTDKEHKFYDECELGRWKRNLECAQECLKKGIGQKQSKLELPLPQGEGFPSLKIL